MTRSGTFVYMRYASAVGLLPWECEMGSSRTAFSIVTSRRSARMYYSPTKIVGPLMCFLFVCGERCFHTLGWVKNKTIE